ncbi:MAG: hypothetical protein NTY01_04885, partial [Verrucomicrobia bacterium]|nr:hypothetical protein [Verrucomicrobiota bacterium]
VYHVGYDGSGNSLTLANGASLFASNLWIGTTANARSNAVVVTDAGTRLDTPTLYVGNTSSWSQLNILNGGVVSNIYGYIGYEAASSNNSVLVSGAGSLWANSGGLLVGQDGSMNRLTVSTGGTVVVDGWLAVGGASSSNLRYFNWSQHRQ